MPHIAKKTRERYKTIEILPNILTKGDLEYCVARLMVKYMGSYDVCSDCGRLRTREHRYSDLHDCCKAVDHCAHEFERLYLDKREDDAIASNGSAFWGL